ncbi:MAG TPA: dicarboxylate/amino acid:cation symporter [Gemmatimonadales bacterium]|nr:dicarboxylate/amino acid:cation symporter [Gemmatimonadales bacterium]
MRSHLWMGLGLFAGLVFGVLAALTQNAFLLGLAKSLRPIGTLFLNLLQMVVIPLVATALFAGIAKLGNLRTVGRLVVRTLAFFWGTAVAAIFIGIIVGSLVLPLGRVSPEQQAALREAATADSSFIHKAAEDIPSGARFIVEMIPSNPVKAAVDGNLLPVIVFVTFLAIAAAGLPDDKRRALTDLADGATDALVKIVHWVLLLAPIGIFGLVAPIVAQFGVKLLVAMLWFWAAVILGLLVFLAGVYVPAVALIARVKPMRFLRAVFPSMLMGFSTTSSLATLPTMLQAADRELHLSRSVAAFALPLGASMNRAGSALFQAVAVLFVAQLYGVPLGFGEVFQAGAAVFLASLTVASVPAASVVSLMPAFTATGLPIQGLSILIGLDRIPDMFRTMTNVTGHLAGATVISTLGGEGRDTP